MAMRKAKTKVKLKPGKNQAALRITHPNAAGIDIGSASHYVAVPPDRDDEPVREFHCFTADLNEMADWLSACRVDTVAMESTWVPDVKSISPPATITPPQRGPLRSSRPYKFLGATKLGPGLGRVFRDATASKPSTTITIPHRQGHGVAAGLTIYSFTLQSFDRQNKS